jgi:hypothetical protein
MCQLNHLRNSLFYIKAVKMNKSFILLKWQTRVCAQFPTGKDREHLFVPVIQYVLLRKVFKLIFFGRVADL